LSTITPAASAVSQVGYEERAFGDCPTLESLGAAGDPYCNAYIISDLDTVETDPTDIINAMASKNPFLDGDDNQTKDGLAKIDMNSNLGKYIKYCNLRESPFGVVDQNILQNFQGGTGISVVDNAIYAVPFVGDILSGFSEEEGLAAYGWVSGESCVIGNNTNVVIGHNSINWEEAKNYQRYIQDMRLLENEGALEDSSPVTIAIEEYYAENPLDQSYEGILARKSGMTKNQVIAALDIVEEYQFLADYNPSGYGPYPQKSDPDTYLDAGIIADHHMLSTMLSFETHILPNWRHRVVMV
jgi:hypothetical protein